MPPTAPPTDSELTASRAALDRLVATLQTVLFGQDELIELVVSGVLARGHLLLEAMQERRVTAGGETHTLPDPFFVLATQNPIDLEGTYPLPEAQLDRFLFKINIHSNAPAVLKRIILNRELGEEPAVAPVIGRE